MKKPQSELKVALSLLLLVILHEIHHFFESAYPRLQNECGMRINLTSRCSRGV